MSSDRAKVFAPSRHARFDVGMDAAILQPVQGLTLAQLDYLRFKGELD
jgi:hypothetical protein